MKTLILFLILLLSFIIVTTVYNYTVINSTETAIEGSGYVLIVFMIFTSLFFVYNFKKISIIPSIIKLSFLFGFFAIISTIAYHSGDILDLIRKLNGVAQWIFCLFLGFIISFTKKENAYLAVKYLTFLTLPFVCYYIFSSLALRLVISDKSASDIAFILLVLFPFVLFLKNDFLKIVLIFFIGIIAFISFKRTTILGYVYMSFAYFYLTNMKSEISTKKRIGFFLVTAILVIALFFVFTFIENNFGGIILERLNKIQEDEGSGRLEIYASVTNAILSSNILELIFGHGYLAVFDRFEILAHNDFLEIFYDFGLIALIIYLIIFFQLLNYARIFYKFRNTLNINSATFIAAIIAFLMLGLFNCFISSPVYFSTLMFYFGIAIGNLEFEKLSIR
jgi:hypothetical protein